MNTSEKRRSPAVHQIGLASQWDLEPLAESEAPSDSRTGVQRLKHLTDYRQAAGAEFKGPFRLVRRFGRPTGLTPGQRVELVSEGFPAAVTVSLNDHVLQPLPAAGPAASGDALYLARFDISAGLRDRNRLAIEGLAPHPPDTCGAACDVRLEIFVEDQ